jgi:hypothetical protein
MSTSLLPPPTLVPHVAAARSVCALIHDDEKCASDARIEKDEQKQQHADMHVLHCEADNVQLQVKGADAGSVNRLSGVKASNSRRRLPSPAFPNQHLNGQMAYLRRKLDDINSEFDMLDHHVQIPAIMHDDSVFLSFISIHGSFVLDSMCVCVCVCVRV